MSPVEKSAFAAGMATGHAHTTASFLRESNPAHLCDENLCFLVEHAVKLWKAIDPFVEEAKRRGIAKPNPLPTPARNSNTIQPHTP